MVKLTTQYLDVYKSGLEFLAEKTGTHVGDYDINNIPLSFVQRTLVFLIKVPMYKGEVEKIIKDRRLDNEERGRLWKLIVEGTFVGSVRDSLSQIIQTKEFLDLYQKAFVDRKL